MYYSPVEIAERYPDIAKGKARKPLGALIALSILGGAFVALASVAAHMICTLMVDQKVAKIIGALLFPTGLGMILVAGGELFTGNCMLPIAVYRKDITVGQMLKNWAVVYFGNFAGAILIAFLAVTARRSDAAFLEVTIYAAEAKVVLSWTEAFVRGILCNILVCAAVWMSYSMDRPSGKIITMYFPVAMFVICGTEHCVANMFYFTAALFAGGSPLLNWSDIIVRNMIPVTLGNIVGGGLIYSVLIGIGLFHSKKKAA